MRGNVMSRTLWKVLTLTLLAAGVAGPALADAIDGEWCSDDGRHLSIQGPSIVTPGGKHMEGAYTRHSFEYTIPPLEPDAGRQTTMRLLSETSVEVRVGAPESAPVVWRRCPGTVS
jgi:hypothetical protein